MAEMTQGDNVVVINYMPSSWNVQAARRDVRCATRYHAIGLSLLLYRNAVVAPRWLRPPAPDNGTWTSVASTSGRPRVLDVGLQLQ